VAPFQNAGINVEPAWEITTGIPEVRVGVVDGLVHFWHPDFNEGSSTGSKVVGGFNYAENQPFDDANIEDQYYQHGTNCAGIIGAIRNNDEGVAGIAGGDAEQGSTGCSLITLAIFYAEGAYSTTTANAQAIVEGSSETGALQNFACQVLNNSYGAGGSPNELLDHELRRSVESCYRNACVFVAAGGNGQSPPIYPASYGDDLSVLRVSASGPNGSIMTVTNGGQQVNQGGDVIAPGFVETITTTSDPFMDWPFACIDAGEWYDCFQGSSSAAAHVSGVAALMLSEHNLVNGANNNLAPEDVEIIIEKGANDIGPDLGYPTGFDGANGWGRLNAGEAVRLVSSPYRVYHSGDQDSEEVYFQPVGMVDLVDFSGWANLWDLVPGSYTVQQADVTHQYTVTFGPNTTIVHPYAGSPGYWGRRSGVVGLLPLQGDNDASWDFQLVGNTINVTAYTRCYKVITGPGGIPINRWIPEPPDKLKTPWSVHLRDNFIVGVEEVEMSTGIALFPNPSSDQVRIQWNDPAAQQLEVVDALGRVVYQEQLRQQGNNERVLAVGDWANGLYTARVLGPKAQHASRFIKKN